MPSKFMRKPPDCVGCMLPAAHLTPLILKEPLTGCSMFEPCSSTNRALRQGLHRAPDHKPSLDLSSLKMQLEQQIDLFNGMYRRPVFGQQLDAWGNVWARGRSCRE